MKNDEDNNIANPAPPDPDPRSLLDAVVSKAVHTAGSEAGLVSLWEDEESAPFHISSYGLDEEEARAIANSLCPYRQKQLPPPKQKREKHHTTAPVAAGDQPFSVVAHLRGGPVQMTAIPLNTDGKVVGLLCLLDPAAAEQVKDKALKLVVQQVDIVVQNTRLFRRVLNEKRWLEEVIQQAGEAILIVDRQRRIIGLNRALEQMSGWRGAEIWGRDAQRVFDFRPPEDSGNYFALPAPDGHQHKMSEGDWLTDHLEDAEIYETPNQRVPADELTIRTWDNRRVPVEASCGVIRNDGQVLGATITLHDISSRKEAEQLQATFLSVISHELQTPIAVIKGYAGLLGDTVGPDNLQARQQLDTVYEESERLSKMVDNLLMASRIQAGGLELHREPVDVGGLLRRTAEKMSALLGGDRKWRIHVDVAANLPAADADYGRIEQVLTNLIENALKYAPEGDITLSASAKGGELTLCVADEGAGVPAAERERIFTPFTRLDSRRVREMKGVGLGLYIARSIINAHGGHIWVEDGNDGKGACFCFTLPADTGE